MEQDEKLVIGGLLTYPAIIQEIYRELSPDHFQSKELALVCRAVIDVHAAQKVPDVLTVKSQLEKTGDLQYIGGIFGLSQLTDDIILHQGAIIQAFERLKEAHSRRQLEAMALRLSSLAILPEYEPEDLAREFGGEALALVANQRKGISCVADDDFRLSHIKQLEARQNAKKDGGLIGVPSGLSELDELTGGFQEKKLIILAARPAMGKSAMALKYARDAARSGVSSLIFSLEMGEEELMDRIMSAEARVNGSKFRTANFSPLDWEAMMKAEGEIGKMKIFIDDTPGIDILDLRAKAMEYKIRHGIGLIIVDYLQLMVSRSGRKGGGNREQEISDISRKLKEIAKELDVPVIALSQLSRAVETRGGDKKPMLSDLRESGAIEQDADMVMFLYRPEYYGIANYEDGSSTAGIAHLIIAKFRGGPLADIALRFVPQYTDFENLDNDPLSGQLWTPHND